MERGARGVVCHGQRDLSEVFKQGPDVLRCASGKTVPVAIQRRWAWRKGQLGSCDSLSGSGCSGGDGTEKAGFSRMSCVMGKGRQEGGMAPRVLTCIVGQELMPLTKRWRVQEVEHVGREV